jgi:hypothetical protein
MIVVGVERVDLLASVRRPLKRERPNARFRDGEPDFAGSPPCGRCGSQALPPGPRPDGEPTQSELFGIRPAPTIPIDIEKYADR